MQKATKSPVTVIKHEKVPSDVEGPPAKTRSFIGTVTNKLRLRKRNWSFQPVVKKKRRVGVVDQSTAANPTNQVEVKAPHQNGTSAKTLKQKAATAEKPELKIEASLVDLKNLEKSAEAVVHKPKPSETSAPSKQNGWFPLIQQRNTSSKNTLDTGDVTPSGKLKHRSSVQKFGQLSLLTPALILHPDIHGKDVISKNFGNAPGDSFYLHLAAAHINDAINGLGKFGQARAIFKSKPIQRCFQIITSKAWAALLYLTIAVHCLMLLWEQPSTPVAIGESWNAWHLSPVILCVDAFCLLIYIADLTLSTIFLSVRNILESKEKVWIRLEFVFTTLFCIDFIVLIVQTATLTRLLCPFRCFRASMLLCKSRNVAHIFNVLLSIISKLGKVLLIIAIFIVTFASVGLHIFMNDYHSLPMTCYNETANWNCTNIYSGAFDQVANAAMHMFVLMSTENYPEFIIPAFDKSWTNFFYFGLYLYAGVFFLTAILLAIIVESYWVYSKRHVKEERRQQREELAKAWNLIDPLGTGQISVNDPKLLKLFGILKPKNTDEENQELINYVNMYGDGFIDSYDWTTKLIESLSFVFEEEPSADQTEEPTHEFILKIRKRCKAIIHARVVSISVLFLILCHSILFCLTWYGISDTAQLIIQSTKSTIVALFVIEFILRFAADGRNLLNVFDVLDMSMVLVATAGYIAWYVLFFQTPRVEAIFLGACSVVSGLAILVRAVFNSQHARTAVAVLRNIYPVMFDLILLVLTIIFFYAVVGFEIFQNNTLEKSILAGYEGSYVEYGCGVGFETVGCSLLIVFQIVTTNDWHEIMLGAMLDAGWMSVFYFISCYLIVDMIVMNLFVAISIEAYKKLAIDNNGLDVGKKNAQHDHESMSFKSAAKNTLSEIFASSRKSRSSVGSGTLGAFTNSPYAVRRGTLGSLGPSRTPTPDPRGSQYVNDEDMTITSISENPTPVRRKSSIRKSKPPPVVEEEAQEDQRGGAKKGVGEVDRRQEALKKRQDKRRRERRQTKQEEKKVSELVTAKEESKLQIDGVVRLKRAVHVIKEFHARNTREMNLRQGDVVTVSDVTQNMYRGPEGWFPADHVVPVGGASEDAKAPSIQVPEPSSSTAVTGTESPKHHHHVKFDTDSLPPDTRRSVAPSSPHHRISQTRIRKKNDGTDWRRQILGDITVMDRAEMNALKDKFRGGLERRHTQLRYSTNQLALPIREESLEEEEEEEEEVPLPSPPKLTVSEVIQVEPEPEPGAKIQEEKSTSGNDNNTLTLPEAEPRSGKSAQRSKKGGVSGGVSGSGQGDRNPPDWVANFAQKNQVLVDQDVKLKE